WTSTRVTGAPTFPNVNALAIDPKATATLYAGTSAGVYKSTSSGINWALAGSDTSGARTVAIDPQNSSTLYAAGSTMRKSTDGGATWKVSGAGIPADVTTTVLAIDPFN